MDWPWSDERRRGQGSHMVIFIRPCMLQFVHEEDCGRRIQGALSHTHGRRAFYARTVGHYQAGKAVVMPVVAPVVPSPAKSSKEADSKAEAKSNSRARKKQTWVRIPARPDPNRLTVHEPKHEFRGVHNLRVGGFDHNCLSLVGHLFLRRAL